MERGAEETVLPLPSRDESAVPVDANPFSSARVGTPTVNCWTGSTASLNAYRQFPLIKAMASERLLQIVDALLAIVHPIDQALHGIPEMCPSQEVVAFLPANGNSFLLHLPSSSDVKELSPLQPPAD